jgi:hypothetical protein
MSAINCKALDSIAGRNQAVGVMIANRDTDNWSNYTTYMHCCVLVIA